MFPEVYTAPSKKPPDWQMNLFVYGFVVPVMIAYVVWGTAKWAVSRPDRKSEL